MAIVEMKRILLAAPIGQREPLLRRLQQFGSVQVSPFDEELLLEQPSLNKDKPGAAGVEQQVQRLRSAISKLGKHDKRKSGMFTPKPAALMQQMEPSAQEQAGMNTLVGQIEEIERRSGENKAQDSRLVSRRELLLPWQGLDIPLQALRDGQEHHQMLGTMTLEGWEAFRAEWAGRPVHLEEISRQGELLYLWAIVHTRDSAEFIQALKENGFSPVQLGQQEGTVAQELEQIAQQRRVLEDERFALEQRMAALVPQVDALKTYHDAMLGAQQREDAREQLLQTRDAFLLRGWIPAPIAEKVTKTLTGEFPGLIVDISDPEPGEEPPVVLHNPRPFSPFESVVSGYSLPAVDALDPTKVMAPFFACFFGMMVSDAGYGLMVALLVPLLIKVMKPTKAGKKLFWIIGIGGVFTLFWGIMYNTWFGFSPMKNPVFDPLNRPMEIIILCLGLGVLHLLAGMALAIAQNVRAGKYMDAFYDQISWLLVLVGLGMLAVPSLSKIGTWIAAAGGLIILFFSGRNKTRNPFKRLISGLGALYGVTSWLSDILSYLRLFGMGLATGVIGMVINILIGMLLKMGPVGWVFGGALFVGGHLFNAGINILGAYVHAARLQYIEFFNKFYQEGGKAFQPLTHQPRFVRISDAQ